VDRKRLGAWIDLYERAWRSEGTSLLAELFSSTARYKTAPYEKPFEGLPAIAEMWESERESPDEVFEMTHGIVAVESLTGVAKVEVFYGDPVAQEYKDIWIIHFDHEGRCDSFEEWPFWPPGKRGGWIPGPG
jgi:hypothetical protein